MRSLPRHFPLYIVPKINEYRVLLPVNAMRDNQRIRRRDNHRISRRDNHRISRRGNHRISRRDNHKISRRDNHIIGEAVEVIIS